MTARARNQAGVGEKTPHLGTVASRLAWRVGGRPARGLLLAALLLMGCLPLAPAAPVVAARYIPAPTLGPAPSGAMAQSWVAHFSLSGHIFHPGDTITGHITVEVDHCFQYKPCYGGTNWPVYCPPGATTCVAPGRCRPKDLVCSWKAGPASNKWIVLSMPIGNPLGSAYSQDFYAIVGPTTHVLDGLVTGPDGTGVPGVTVFIAGAEDYDTVTDSNGYYNALLPSGTYTVAAGMPGEYKPTRARVDLVDHTTANFAANTCDQFAGSTFEPKASAMAPARLALRAVSADRATQGVAMRAAAPVPAVCQSAMTIQFSQHGAEITTKISITNTGKLTLTNLQVIHHIFPAFNLNKPRQLSDNGTVTKDLLGKVHRWVITWKKQKLAPGAVWAVSYTTKRPDVVAAPSKTVDNFNKWSANGWQTSDMPTPVPPQRNDKAGYLLFSDGPETICDAARPGSRNGNVEGVLFRTPSTQSLSTPFRLYLNHENGTSEPKQIYFVVRAQTRGAATLTRHGYGIATATGDPVLAGREALKMYFGNSATDNTILTIPALAATAPVSVTTVTKAFLVQSLAGYKAAVNALYDLVPGAPVDVAVVVVNPSSAARLMKNPAAFLFGNQPGRGVFTDKLLNPAGCSGTTHLRGTFAYNAVAIQLPVYNMDGVPRYGYRLADDKLNPKEFSGATDPVGVANKGNYGVLYHVTVSVTGSIPGEQATIFLNPRSASPRHDEKIHGKTVTVAANAFSGYVMINGKGPYPVPASGNITNTNKAIVLGSISLADAAHTLTLDFMPPAGSSLPVAIVVLPTYLTGDASLSWSGAKAPITATKTVAFTPS